MKLTLVQLIPGAVIRRQLDELYNKTAGWFITDLPHEYSASKYRIAFPKDHPFVIDSSSGNIALLEEVDYETVKEYSFVVEEVNLNKANEYTNYKIQVNLVDANDNRPYFTMKNLFAKVCFC